MTLYAQFNPRSLSAIFSWKQLLSSSGAVLQLFTIVTNSTFQFKTVINLKFYFITDTTFFMLLLLQVCMLLVGSFCLRENNSAKGNNK